MIINMLLQMSNTKKVPLNLVFVLFSVLLGRFDLQNIIKCLSRITNYLNVKVLQGSMLHLIYS